MTLEDFALKFDQYTIEDKRKLLTLMVLALTVEARSATFEQPAEQATIAYRGINELQHVIANQLCAYFTNGDIRPNQVLWSTLREIAEHTRVDKNLFGAVSWSFSREMVRRSEEPPAG
jgi:hypothetical protein